MKVGIFYGLQLPRPWQEQSEYLGGVVTCAVRGCPPGWGEPVFDRLEAVFARAVLACPRARVSRSAHCFEPGAETREATE